MTTPGKHAVVFIAGLVLAGCDRAGSLPSHLSGLNGSVAIEMGTDQTSYGQGALVRLTIVNPESVVFWYNACSRHIEKKEGAEWIPGPESLRVCTAHVDRLEAGATLADSTDLDIGLVPGEYRLAIDFMADTQAEESIRVLSNPLLVQP